MDNRKITLRQIALFGVLGALTFGAKVAMSALPNIEPVSLLVMLFAVVFGRRCLYPIYLYVMLEILFYGIQLWNINYLYVWAILALLTSLFRAMDSVLGWAVLSGAFGLCFGLLCAPVYWVTGGWAFALSWWVSGIPYDLLHGIGNFFVALALFKPCRRVLDQLCEQYY